MPRLIRRSLLSGSHTCLAARAKWGQLPKGLYQSGNHTGEQDEVMHVV